VWEIPLTPKPPEGANKPFIGYRSDYEKRGYFLTIGFRFDKKIAL
jgi:hypothetical protein